MSDDLRQAIEAYKRGDKKRCLKIVSSFLKKNPESEQGWLLVALCVEDEDRQRQCYRRVLQINPDNKQARDALKSWAGRERTGTSPEQQSRQSHDEEDKPTQKNLGEQASYMVKKVYKRVSEICTEDEKILYIAVRNKFVDLTPDSVVLTSRRFFICHPKLFGRFDFEDYIWRELYDAHLKEDLLGATITMQTTKGHRLCITRLPKAQARRIYAIAQKMEERVREERRKRKMEEERARSGGIIFQGREMQPGSIKAASQDPVQKLKQLKEMLKAELITENDYEEKKKELLSQM